MAYTKGLFGDGAVDKRRMAGKREDAGFLLPREGSGGTLAGTGTLLPTGTDGKPGKTGQTAGGSGKGRSGSGGATDGKTWFPGLGWVGGDKGKSGTKPDAPGLEPAGGGKGQSGSGGMTDGGTQYPGLSRVGGDKGQNGGSSGTTDGKAWYPGLGWVGGDKGQNGGSTGAPETGNPLLDTLNQIRNEKLAALLAETLQNAAPAEETPAARGGGDVPPPTFPYPGNGAKPGATPAENVGTAAADAEGDGVLPLVEKARETVDFSGWEDKTAEQQRQILKKSGLTEAEQWILLNKDGKYLETLSLTAGLRENRRALGLSMAETDAACRELLSIAAAWVDAKSKDSPFTSPSARRTFLTLLDEKQEKLLRTLGYSDKDGLGGGQGSWYDGNNKVTPDAKPTPGPQTTPLPQPGPGPEDYPWSEEEQQARLETLKKQFESSGIWRCPGGSGCNSMLQKPCCFGTAYQPLM